MEEKKKDFLEKYKYMNRNTKENIEYWCMMILPLLTAFIFRYITSYTQVTAFQDWIPGAPYFGDNVKWVGLKWFKIIVKDKYIWRGVVNTLRLFLVSTPFLLGPIIFATVLSELRSKRLAGVTRLMCYIPSFMSEIVTSAIFVTMLGSTGILTQFVRFLGIECVSLLMSKTAFPWTYAMINCWQTFAWGSLLYQATIAGVDPGLYDSARIDGCSNRQRIMNVVWPHLKPIVSYTLIMRCAGLLGSDVVQIVRMYNPGVYETADTIGTYVYRVGLQNGRYSYGAAVSLFQSVINFGLLWTCNKICRKYAEYSLW